MDRQTESRQSCATAVRLTPALDAEIEELRRSLLEPERSSDLPALSDFLNNHVERSSTMPAGVDCVICTDSDCRDTVMKISKCSHIFHAKCIREWFEGPAFSHNTCPCCRTPLFRSFRSARAARRQQEAGRRRRMPFLVPEQLAGEASSSGRAASPQAGAAGGGSQGSAQPSSSANTPDSNDVSRTARLQSQLEAESDEEDGRHGRLDSLLQELERERMALRETLHDAEVMVQATRTELLRDVNELIQKVGRLIREFGVLERQAQSENARSRRLEHCLQQLRQREGTMLQVSRNREAPLEASYVARVLELGSIMVGAQQPPRPAAGSTATGSTSAGSTAAGSIVTPPAAPPSALRDRVLNGRVEQRRAARHRIPAQAFPGLIEETESTARKSPANPRQPPAGPRQSAKTPEAHGKKRSSQQE